MTVACWFRHVFLLLLVVSCHPLGPYSSINTHTKLLSPVSLTSGMLTVDDAYTCFFASSFDLYCAGNAVTINNKFTKQSFIISSIYKNENIKSLSVGVESTCAIAVDDQVYCWGNNSSGNLGDSGYANLVVPFAVYNKGVLNGKKLTLIGVGDGVTCAVANDGLAYCWGDNQVGSLGDASNTDSSIPVAVNVSGVLAGKTIKSLSVSSHACVIASDDNAYCWGANLFGELGNALNTNSNIAVAVNKSGVLSGKTIKAIATGGEHTCAIASDDKVYCWGRNNKGQLGDGTNTDSNVAVAINTSGVLSGKTIKAIAAGERHTCAIAGDENAYCWGDNVTGQLGDSANTDSNVAVAVNTSGVLSGLNIKSISLGVDSTCAVASNNQLYCWGRNTNGKLGDGSFVNSNIAVAVNTSGVLSGKNIIKTSVGSDHACAIASDNKVYCWGNGDLLGAGIVGNSNVAVAVFNYNYAETNPLMISVSRNISKSSLGKYYRYDGLGRITSLDYFLSPYFSSLTIKLVSVGINVSCVVMSDEKIYCWGVNNVGQLGDGSTNDSDSPVAVDMTGVLSGKTIKGIYSGYDNTCVIADDDNVYCWGWNGVGLLGDGTLVNHSSVPVAVSTVGALSGKTVKTLSVYGDHICAIASDNNLYCWGNNTNGELGIGTNLTSRIPVAVSAAGALLGKTIKSVSVGYGYTCAIASDQKVYCWGQNDKGQLGNGTNTDSNLPVAVNTDGALFGKEIIAVKTSEKHACAVDSSNQIYCWGSNAYGQLANGTNTDSTVPVVSELPQVYD